MSLALAFTFNNTFIFISKHRNGDSSIVGILLVETILLYTRKCASDYNDNKIIIIIKIQFIIIN